MNKEERKLEKIPVSVDVDFQIKENSITVDEYLKLRKLVGWKHLSEKQAKGALDKSLYTVGAYVAGQLIGMGRVVGDGAVICYVQDLIIPPQVQFLGIGSVLLKKIIDYAESIREPGTELMLDLMCAKGREAFYERHGFISRPNDSLGPGMIQYLTPSRKFPG